ncbi:MAG: rhodanese-like domain-containing protein [Candidatus Krumholzibacteriota bacterium]|nr:rhodanese-like domain-containing protein [Candidatus Krumholzibacteriota bacterium]
MEIKRTIIQAIAVCCASTLIAFTYNAFSDNGINPFRQAASEKIAENIDNSAGNITVIDLKKFREMKEEGILLIDARTESEYINGHIPGALLFDYYKFGSFADKVIPLIYPWSSLVIYCSSPACDSSDLLAAELYQLGYKNIFVFEGGFSNWKEEGLPVEKGLE